MNNDLYKRLARAEAQEALRRADSLDFLQERYEIACQEQNEEDAAMYVRSIRNKLLDATDKDLCADRSEEHKNKWIPYRQALRDLPEQSGFPFDVTFPIPPEAKA